MHVAAGPDPLDRLPDVGAHAGRLVDDDQDIAVEALEAHPFVRREAGRIAGGPEPQLRLERLRVPDLGLPRGPMDLGPQHPFHLVPRRRRRDRDAVGMTGDPPEDRSGGGERLRASMARLHGGARIRGHRAQDRLLRIPEVLPEQHPGEPDGIANDR